MFILCELMTKGSLADKLKEKEPVDLKRNIRWAIEISSGMKFLHSLNLIHRDLKSLNLLVSNLFLLFEFGQKMDENSKLKIIDFGTSRVVDMDKAMTGKLGTPGWCICL